MQEIYSALLLHSANRPITVENIKRVLEVVGASVEEGRIKALVSSLEGKNIDKLIEEASAAAAPLPVEKEKKEEEKKAEKAATAGLSALFG